jgi:hypothetical protein
VVSRGMRGDLYVGRSKQTQIMWNLPMLALLLHSTPSVSLATPSLEGCGNSGSNSNLALPEL